jgi:hypothetical protein
MRDFKFLVMIIVLLVACPSFKRNPNLRLLLKEEGYSLLNPRWTKSGWVYYIRCYYEEFGNYGPGEIWRIKDNGQNNELVFSDSFFIMDISPSETLLIAFLNLDYDSPLFSYNLKTAKIETLVNAYYPNAAGLQFGSSDTFVYYNDNYGLHRINIYTKSDTVIVPSGVAYFDIYHDSLLYYNQRIIDIFTGAVVYESSNLWKGIFAQSKDSLLLVRERKDGLQLYDIKGDTLYILDAAPYDLPIWNDVGNCIDFDSSGQKIIFSATCQFLESGGGDPFELWILEEF